VPGSYHKACGCVCYTAPEFSGISIPWNPLGRAVTDLPLLFSELIRFETELWDAIDARLRAECNLALGRFEVLRVIARHGRCRVQDIADELAITIGGTSKIVDRIEASGYCCRRPNPDDQRSSLIALTPAGERIFTQATDVFEAELACRFGAVLSARSLDQLHTTLVKLRAAGHRLDRRDRQKEPSR
jgi:DNA-binding MarR family transcriptional regulator